jgi:hypothetical protein
MVKGKGSVIISKIYVMPIEGAEGVSTERLGGEDFSSSSRIDSIFFRFLDTEGSGDIFGLFDSLFFLSFLIDLIACLFEREMCPWAISKYFGDLVSNTSA